MKLINLPTKLDRNTKTKSKLQKRKSELKCLLETIGINHNSKVEGGC